MSDNATLTVQSDAQMSMFQVLRPMANFEAIYQGQAGVIPIAFPGTLDIDAGKQGYDANLLAGVPVPLGARILLQIPMTLEMYTPVATYQYQFIWRTRNQAAAAADIASGRRQPAPYHLDDSRGRREFQGSASERFFIPGASDVEIFEQGEPVSGAALLNIKQQRYVPQITAPWVQPLTPTGTPGVWQQGAYQFSSNENCSGPTWVPLFFDSLGDELMILVYKTNTEANWDFAGGDLAFSNTYGSNDGGLPVNPNIGILLSTGTQGS